LILRKLLNPTTTLSTTGRRTPQQATTAMADKEQAADDAAAAKTEGSQQQATVPSALPSASQPLYLQYPMSSSWELTLTNDDKVQGEVYCTDPISQIVVLQDQLSDIRMISVASIREAKLLKEASPDPAAAPPANTVHAKKALEEREKRAIKIAQESFRHINPKVRYPLRCTKVDAIFRV
jgi:hypothetical protein